MAPGLQRTSFNSSGLVRLLADMTVADGAVAVGAPSNQTLAERLGQWLDWTDAITLSAALSGAPSAAGAAAEPGMPASASAIAEAIANECARVRAGLAQTIAAEGLFAVGQTGPLHSAIDFPTCRRAYLAHQRAMTTRLGALRAQVRAALAKASPSLQRLAALDAAMDDALAAREGHLLAKVPGLLERHFVRLRQAQPEGSADGVAEFLEHMQAVLLAELALRLQPIEAMVDVLDRKSVV